MVQGHFTQAEEDILSRIRRLRRAKERLAEFALSHKDKDARMFLLKINDIKLRINELNRVLETYF